MTAMTATTDLPEGLFFSIQRATMEYHYRGIRTIKDPFDLALYALLLWNVRPKTVIEIGSYKGGSALWMADQLRAFGIDGHVHSVDNGASESAISVVDPDITFYNGDGENLAAVFANAAMPRPWLVVEDSSHQYEIVTAVLEYFAPMMMSGEYIVVEDGMTNAGPLGAIAEFVERHSEFEVDRRYCDYFGHNVTWCVNGFLRRL